MTHLEKMKLKDASGAEYVCACFKLYGCPIWVPLNAAENLDQQITRAKKLFEQSTKVIDQLQEIKELADQISAARLH